MVAQQILVLFVLVRIRVEQLILVFSQERARIFFMPAWLVAAGWLLHPQDDSFAQLLAEHTAQIVQLGELSHQGEGLLVALRLLDALL